MLAGKIPAQGRSLSAKPTVSLSCISLLHRCWKWVPKNYSKGGLTNVIKPVFVQHHVHEKTVHNPIISEGVKAFLGTD